MWKKCKDSERILYREYFQQPTAPMEETEKWHAILYTSMSPSMKAFILPVLPKNLKIKITYTKLTSVNVTIYMCDSSLHSGNKLSRPRICIEVLRKVLDLGNRKGLEKIWWKIPSLVWQNFFTPSKYTTFFMCVAFTYIFLIQQNSWAFWRYKKPWNPRNGTKHGILKNHSEF